MTANILNDQVHSFETTSVEFEFESLDGKYKLLQQIVTGSLKRLNWNTIASKWHH